jgi:hypothetical protein
MHTGVCDAVNDHFQLFKRFANRIAATCGDLQDHRNVGHLTVGLVDGVGDH